MEWTVELRAWDAVLRCVCVYVSWAQTCMGGNLQRGSEAFGHPAEECVPEAGLGLGLAALHHVQVALGDAAHHLSFHLVLRRH